MPHPFQCLLHCSRPPNNHFLIAAAGSHIRIFDSDTGVHSCSWPSAESNGTHEICSGRAALNHDDDSPPPAKRLKLPLEKSESSSAEIVVDEPEGPQAPNPPIVRLAATSNGHHVVALTGEDKCIRVFELSVEGKLKLFSERFGLWHE